MIFCFNCGSIILNPTPGQKYCCKKCKRRAFYLNHRQEELDRGYRWRAKHPDKFKKYQQRWRSNKLRDKAEQKYNNEYRG